MQGTSIPDMKELGDIGETEGLAADANALREMQSLTPALTRIVQARDGRDPRVPR